MAVAGVNRARLIGPRGVRSQEKAGNARTCTADQLTLRKLGLTPNDILQMDDAQKKPAPRKH